MYFSYNFTQFCQFNWLKLKKCISIRGNRKLAPYWYDKNWCICFRSCWTRKNCNNNSLIFRIKQYYMICSLLDRYLIKKIIKIGQMLWGWLILKQNTLYILCEYASKFTFKSTKLHPIAFLFSLKCSCFTFICKYLRKFISSNVIKYTYQLWFFFF